MSTISATPSPTTGTVLVNVEQSLARDLFTRVVANGWGSATTGQAWTFGGGVAADYSVNGTQGLISVTAVNAIRRQTFNTGFNDHDITMQVTIPTVALTAPISPAVLFRLTDANNYYYAEIAIAPAGTVTLQIKKRVLSANGVITGTFVLPVTHVAGTTYRIRAAACGNMVKAKAWVSTVAEPDWMLSATPGDLPTGTLAGARAFLEAGNTNVLPYVFTWDNMVTISSQPIRVFRVASDGTRTELRGSPVNTEPATAAAATATAVLWDSEAPFDDAMTYQLTSDCSPTVPVVTSGSVTLVSGGDGWLRDPVDPTLNFPLVIDATYDECLDQDIVVLSGLGDPEYSNASGIFDIINSPRPNTVSMIRKNYASALSLTSFSFDDILALEDIFASGRILLLSLPSGYGWALRTFGTDYITCGDVTQSYLGVDQRVVARGWQIPFRLSYAPPDPHEPGTGGNGIGGGDATYDALAASVIGTTYNSLTAAGFTYSQIAAGTGY